MVREWCEHPSAHETELTSAITAIRSALVDGYAEDAPAKEGYRHRGQALLAHVVDKTSDWLAGYYARNPDERLKEQEEAKSVAKVLDNCCHQLYFASGTFHAQNPREPAGLTSPEEKIRFLGDVEPILRELGDLGASHTIYNLLQILEFLLPVDPGKVFDLIAHALLHGGNRQGYQFDSMDRISSFESLGSAWRIIGISFAKRSAGAHLSTVSMLSLKLAGLRREDSSIDFLSCSIEKPNSQAREERGRFGRNSRSSSRAIGSVSTNQPAWAVGSWKCASLWPLQLGICMELVYIYFCSGCSLLEARMRKHFTRDIFVDDFQSDMPRCCWRLRTLTLDPSQAIFSLSGRWVQSNGLDPAVRKFRLTEGNKRSHTVAQFFAIAASS